MAVSFLTGRIIYISEQAGVLLRCKRDVFRGARFSELLAPQDVGVFYGSTTPSRLPTWGPGASAGEVPKCSGEDEQSPEATAVRAQGTQAFPCWVFLSPGRRWGAILTATWSVSGSDLKDFTQEKSVFCRIRSVGNVGADPFHLPSPYSSLLGEP